MTAVWKLMSRLLGYIIRLKFQTTTFHTGHLNRLKFVKLRIVKLINDSTPSSYFDDNLWADIHDFSIMSISYKVSDY